VKVATDANGMACSAPLMMPSISSSNEGVLALDHVDGRRWLEMCRASQDDSLCVAGADAHNDVPGPRRRPVDVTDDPTATAMRTSATAEGSSTRPVGDNSNTMRCGMSAARGALWRARSTTPRQ